MENTDFNWQRCPEAEQLILDCLKEAEKNIFLSDLNKDFNEKCNTNLLAWIDHIVLPFDQKERVEKVGFQEIFIENGLRVFRHLGAQLPDIALSKGKKLTVAIIVESIADFLMVRGMQAEIQGSAYSGYRRADVSEDSNCKVVVVERRGVQTLDPVSLPSSYLENYFLAKELWMTRPRGSKNEEHDFAEAKACVKKMITLLGQDPAACLVLACERAYWEAKNTAGQIQKNRQDRLGMGWANHDHHTFRSSRAHFPKLVQLFEMLGFHCRERFYAGKQAGWGAQVMENPRAKLVLFLDVDLTQEEVSIDFAHEKLPDSNHLGTIGLWCALHGDSILKAGMHHLEAQFQFEELRLDLKAFGVNLMEPFSYFPYLKQAFTQGEIWPVDPEKVELLLKNKLINEEQKEKFLSQGAVGSHLENLQRTEGYKGFNQNNVSLIIKATDPRAY